MAALRPKARPAGHDDVELLAYTETSDMLYCQYIFRSADGDYYAVRVPQPDATPIVAPMTKMEAEQACTIMKRAQKSQG